MLKTVKISQQNKKFFLNPYYPFIIGSIVAFFVADLVILQLRPSFLPSGLPPNPPLNRLRVTRAERSALETIIRRNMFSFDNLIPNPITKDGSNKDEDEEVPVPSQLPLELIGTIVHANPAKSVASISLKNKNEILAVRKDGDLDGLANVLKIERGKVFIRNNNNSRLEYIEVKNEMKISFKGKSPKAEETVKRGDVLQVSENKFLIKRNDINKYLGNINAILQQARSDEVRNAQGQIEGFRILDYQPGSIYEQLGFKRGDIIKGVNGEPVDSRQKALELYAQLKSSEKVNITVMRNGREETLEYSIPK